MSNAENKCYLYSTKTGELKIYEGFICNYPYDKRKAVFVTEQNMYIVATEPGVYYNSMLWLPEKDDKTAVDIIMEYEEQKIARLYADIKKHTSKVESVVKFIDEGVLQ